MQVPSLPPAAAQAPPVIISLYLSDSAGSEVRQMLLDALRPWLDGASPIRRHALLAAMERLRSGLDLMSLPNARGIALFTPVGASTWLVGIPLDRRVPPRMFTGSAPVTWPARAASSCPEVHRALRDLDTRRARTP